MYKALLCWRYLRTRYLALACVVSVMLGVATLIVVNSVMGGFSTKLRQRLHGLLSDVVIEARDINGFAGADQMMERIHEDPLLKQHVEAMSPTLEVFAMLQYQYHGRIGDTPVARPIRLIGIDPVGRASVGGFAEHLSRHRGSPTFELDEEAKRRFEWNNQAPAEAPLLPDPLPGQPPLPEPPPSQKFEPIGAIVGHAIAHYRMNKPDEQGNHEMQVLPPGEDVVITTISGSSKLAPVFARFAVADYFKSEMSEYDSNYVFVPLRELQNLRGMQGKVSSIQIKLKDERNKEAVVARLKEMFAGDLLVQTWEDKQGPLLAAISIEKGILNVLLFLIVAVAGFGILAIFSMIVVEKTKDIGILKALGASNWGIMQIFLGYGLLLGALGAALGTALGLWITRNINRIEQVLSWATGLEVFPRTIYYFDSIPTDIQAWHVALVNLGAVAIAVVFSILPALRAAWLHPVQALRYE